MAKLARAALLNAEAAKLSAEAFQELAEGGEAPPAPEVTEMDRARARRLLVKIGARFPE